jgi:TonB family protein
MRRILVASLLLSPLVFTTAAVAGTPATDAAVLTQVRPVSSGVKPAHVVSAVNVVLPYVSDQTVFTEAEVVLHLNVDSSGKPQNIQVIKSPSITLNEPVLAAVRQFQFEPATVNNQFVAMPMTLTVVVRK